MSDAAEQWASHELSPTEVVALVQEMHRMDCAIMADREAGLSDEQIAEKQGMPLRAIKSCTKMPPPVAEVLAKLLPDVN